MKNKLILLLVSLLMTGCYNYNELNDIAIVSGLGIDMENNNFKISALVANGQSLDTNSKEGNAQPTLITGTGSNFTEAIKDIESKSARELYTGHLNIVIINEKVAKERLYDIIDPLFRNPETLKKYYIILSKDTTSENILKTLSPLETLPAENTSLNIVTSKRNLGYSNEVFLSNFIYKILNKGIEPVLPTIILEGNIEGADNIEDLKSSKVDTTLKMSTLALFKDYNLVGFADINESKGINIVNNEIDSLTITNKCNNDKYIVTQIDNIKSKIKIKSNKEINIKIKTTGSINETNCKLDLQNDKVIKNINKTVEKNIKKIINKGIKKAKELDSDVFGFGNKIYKKYRYLDYDFRNLKINIDVDVDLKTKGSLETTIKEVNNEDK
jgi:spore germination protein KC